jgi:hypothetical protein
MEQVVIGDHKDPSELFIVIGHHGGARSLLSHGKEVVDVFNRSKSLLPYFELDCAFQLGKSCVEMSL